MPTGVTSKSDTVNPILFSEAVKEAVSSKEAFFGSALAAAGVVVVEGNMPKSGPEAIGETITIPYFNWLGEFQDLSDGIAATSRKAGQTKESATVARASLMFDITNWSRNASAQGTGEDIYTNAARQVRDSAVRKMGKACLDAAVATSGLPILDRFSASVPVTMNYDVFTQGKMLWGDFQDDGAAMIVHSKTYGDLLLLKDGAGRPLLDPPSAALPNLRMFGGMPVIPSDRLPVDTVVMGAVTSAGTTPPVITLTGTITRRISLRIRCTVLGARGTSKIQYSIDGGVNWSVETLTAATVAVSDPLDDTQDTGLVIGIAAGNAAVDNTWTAEVSTARYTSLLCKRSALAFWYNSAALGLQQQPEISTDSVKGAVHLYYAAYRYKFVNGMPKPGIVAVKHN